MTSSTPSFTWIGTSCDLCKASSLTVANFGTSEGSLTYPFTDRTEIWHATLNALPFQILG